MWHRALLNVPQRAQVTAISPLRSGHTEMVSVPLRDLAYWPHIRGQVHSSLPWCFQTPVAGPMLTWLCSSTSRSQLVSRCRSDCGELYVNLFSSPKSYDSTSVLNPKSMTYSRMSFKNIQFHSTSKYRGKQNPCIFLINSSFFYELTLLMDSLSRYRKPGILEPSEVISLRHHNAQTIRPPTLRT